MAVVHQFFRRWTVYVTVLNFPATVAATFIFKVWPNVCHISVCLDGVLLPLLWIFNVCTNVMHVIAHRGCSVRTLRVCTESLDWEKNSLLHQGVQPASVACWTWLSTNWASFLPCPVFRFAFLFLCVCLFLCLSVSFSVICVSFYILCDCLYVFPFLSLFLSVSSLSLSLFQSVGAERYDTVSVSVDQNSGLKTQ